MELDRNEAISQLVDYIPQLDDDELKHLVAKYGLEVSERFRTYEDTEQGLITCTKIWPDGLIRCEECPFTNIGRNECMDVLMRNALHYMQTYRGELFEDIAI